MLGLHEHLFVAVARDGIECLPVIEGTNKLGASFETPCGRLLVFFFFFLVSPVLM